MERFKSCKAVSILALVMLVFGVIQLIIWYYEEILDIKRASVALLYSSGLISNINENLIPLKVSRSINGDCKSINITKKIINNVTLNCGWGGFGNFLEDYFHKLSCQCLLLLYEYKNITSYDHTIRKTGYNRFYYHFVEYVPHGIDYIDSVCSPFLCYIEEHNFTDFYNKERRDDICWRKIRGAPWGSIGLVSYYNTPFIKAISTEFNRVLYNFNKKYNVSDDIIFDDCDITIHARLGDNIRGFRGCWPRAGFFAMSYFSDAIDSILLKLPKCKENININKKVYIVTQLTHTSVRNSTDDQLGNITNQVIYTYQNEIIRLYSKYGYSTQIISTNLLNDWNILRNSKNLICVTSTFCHTASIASKYGINTNVIMPGIATFNPLSQSKKIWKNTYPINHIGYIPTNNYMSSCDLYRLKWNTIQTVHKFLEWIVNPHKV